MKVNKQKFLFASWAGGIVFAVAGAFIGYEIKPNVAGIALGFCIMGGAVGVFLMAVVVVAGISGSGDSQARAQSRGGRKSE